MASTQDHAEEYAKELAGNWRKFGSFGWHNQPDDAENFAIIYTSNRDSGLLDQSNAAAIEKALEPFTELRDDQDCGDMQCDHNHCPDVRFESHGHWAVGHVDGFAIRVVDSKGDFTPAFLAYCELRLALEDYPLLDEDDYSRREYEAAIEAIGSHYYALFSDENAPDGDQWAHDVFSWLYENDQSAVENRDDQGAFPERDEVMNALRALGIAFDDPDADEDEAGLGDVESCTE